MQITFDWPVFFSQLFGFAVIVFIIWKWVVPPVKRLMAKSQDAIAKQLTESDHAAQQLEEAKRSYANAITEAHTELEQIRADARADAEYIVAQMREAAAAEVERVRRQGRDQVAQLRRQMVRDLETDLAAAMLAITEEKVRDQVATPEARIGQYRTVPRGPGDPGQLVVGQAAGPTGLELNIRRVAGGATAHRLLVSIPRRWRAESARRRAPQGWASSRNRYGRWPIRPLAWRRGSRSRRVYRISRPGGRSAART